MSVVTAGKQYQWHTGEQKIHKLLKVDRDSRDRADAILTFMPPQHMYFFSNLQYFIIGTLDSQGRPWASILTGDPGFIRAVSRNHLAMVTDISEGDPLLETLREGWTVDEGGRLIAGLGIDLTNRRRNKVAGRVGKDMLLVDGRELQMIISTDESLGNCPKYITVRDIKYLKREGIVKYQVPQMTSGSLPIEALETIEQCDTVFLAARHFAVTPGEINDMDVNHRGGKPGMIRLFQPTAGFVRVEQDGQTIVIPDYSGLAGLVFPNFTTGDILYITGQAENLYGAQADKVMPRTSLVTRVRITGYTYVQAGLNLVATQSHPSPYNPPIKYLSSELIKLGKIPQNTRRNITLIAAKPETRNITTFTFKLQDAIPIIPGQHAILDFSAENSHGYRHMADEAPQSLNDDFIRSWTISSIPEIKDGKYLPTTTFSCTIKNKYGGTISPLLHRWARRRDGFELSIGFIGVEGGFTCFNDVNRVKEGKLLFIAGGVGITPFLCMLAGLRTCTVDVDVVFLFSARGDEIGFATRFVDAGIDTRVFDTGGDTVGGDVEGGEGGLEVHRRRIAYEDIENVPGLRERGVYLCGPDGFMQVVRGYLEKAGVDSGKVNVESFAF